MKLLRMKILTEESLVKIVKELLRLKSHIKNLRKSKAKREKDQFLKLKKGQTTLRMGVLIFLIISEAKNLSMEEKHYLI